MCTFVSSRQELTSNVKVGNKKKGEEKLLSGGVPSPYANRLRRRYKVPTRRLTKSSKAQADLEVDFFFSLLLAHKIREGKCNAVSKLKPSAHQVHAKREKGDE
jgi:hypothetical protein